MSKLNDFGVPSGPTIDVSGASGFPGAPSGFPGAPKGGVGKAHSSAVSDGPFLSIFKFFGNAIIKTTQAATVVTRVGLVPAHLFILLAGAKSSLAGHNDMGARECVGLVIAGTSAMLTASSIAPLLAPQLAGVSLGGMALATPASLFVFGLGVAAVSAQIQSSFWRAQSIASATKRAQAMAAYRASMAPEGSHTVARLASLEANVSGLGIPAVSAVLPLTTLALELALACLGFSLPAGEGVVFWSGLVIELILFALQVLGTELGIHLVESDG